MLFLRKIATRLGATIFLLLLQIAGFTTAFILVSGRYPIIAYIGIFVSIAVLSFIIKTDKDSSYKITWIIIILAVPTFGGIVYGFFGNKRPIKKIAAHVKEHALIAKLLDSDGNLPFMEKIKNSRMVSLISYVRNVSSYHAYQKTAATYYPMGEVMFEDMLAEMESAKKFIFLEYYIIHPSLMWEQMLEVMRRKAGEGVEVRIIVDGLGSQRLFSRSYIRKLEALNIKVLRFNPMVPFLMLFMNNRDHRKILVVDGETAFTGGMNIADEYINLKKKFGLWKDTGIKIRGDAVWSFTLMFIEMWDTFSVESLRITDHLSYKAETPEDLESDGYVLPFGDSPLDHEQLSENILIDLLNQAEKYVYIFTPYLIISEKMTYALQLAAKRGVDVRIVTPGIPDKKPIYRLTRSYYRHLIKAGVRIFEFTPGFLHAKSFVCDDEIAIVGTINLDYRSLYLHFECAALFYQSGIVEEIKADTLKTIGQSREVEMHTYTNRRRRVKDEVMDSLLHLFAPLL